jgi:hypothetical protein
MGVDQVVWVERLPPHLRVEIETARREAIPRYTSSSSLPVRLAIFVAFPISGRLANQFCQLRQIVPHHDVDPDLLLFTQDRLATGEREQHAHGGAGLMTRVLRDRRSHHAL